MRHYLNENIFIENDIFYEENEKKIKIKERDWHIYLSDYGWSKLNKKWIMKLNKLSKTKKEFIIWLFRLWWRWRLFISLY